MKTHEMQARPGNKKGTQNYNDPHRHPELKTDIPLSEKDEVKLAERRMNKPLRKHL